MPANRRSSGRTISTHLDVPLIGVNHVAHIEMVESSVDVTTLFCYMSAVETHELSLDWMVDIASLEKR